MPTRCAAAPSSLGAGILLQSTSSRFLWFMDPHSFAGWVMKRYPSTAVAMGFTALNPSYNLELLSPRPQQAALLPAPVALFLALALVVQLLALGHRQQQLGAAAFVEVKLEWDQRHAVAIDRAHQLVDLLPVQQQLARPLRLMVEAISLQIFRNISVDQPDLAVLGIGIGFRDGGLAVADRLDLGAGQRDARFHRVLDRIIEPGLAVFGDDLDRALVLFGHDQIIPATQSAIAPCPRRCTSRLFEQIADFG